MRVACRSRDAASAPADPQLWEAPIADTIAEAAALFESLAINHPFVDGNKRVAFAAVDVFLRINGIRLVARPLAIHRWMIGHLEKGTFALASIEAYLRRSTRKA